MEEEDLLFVHLDRHNASRTTAEQDHKAIREIMKEIKSDPKNKTIFPEFVNRLEKHIRFEERELFNELQNTLNESELNIIAEKMETLHPALKEDNWKDTFWVKNII